MRWHSHKRVNFLFPQSPIHQFPNFKRNNFIPSNAKIAKQFHGNLSSKADIPTHTAVTNSWDLIPIAHTQYHGNGDVSSSSIKKRSRKINMLVDLYL